MKYLFALLLFVCVIEAAYAQKFSISGKVTDEAGVPVPFGTIYLENTTVGTSANEYGDYRINISKGQYQIIFRFVGYQPKTVAVNIEGSTILNLTLRKELYQLKDVVISSRRTSVDTIMRRAIKNRKKHLEAVTTFSVDVYMKGVQKLAGAPRKFMGENVSKVLSLDSNRKGILYLSESESRLYYKAPDMYREIMTASKVSGKNGSLSFNKATDMTANFYQNILQFDGLSVRGFISPLAEFAFQYYRYKLLGTDVVNGKVVNKIEVIPKRAYDPVFKGIIYVIGDSYQLYAVNLSLARSANINFVDTLKFSQQYIPVENDTWMPSSLQLNFKGKVLGFSFTGYFLSVYSNYNINANLSKQLFNGEILKIVKEVNRRDEEYWQSARPVPLTKEEMADYHKRDSVEQIQNTRAYKDSLDKQSNKISALKLGVLGYNSVSTVHNTTYTFAPILPGVFYNTVEGFGYQYQMTFKKEYSLKNFVDITPKIRYGFANRRLSPSIEGRYFYDPVNKGFLSMKVGREVLEISGLRSSISITNSINTLVYETNNRKFYEKTMLSFSGSHELATGLFSTASIEYGQRRPMLNSSSYSFFDRKNKQFTSNNPFTPLQDIPLFQKHNALTFQAELDYAPAARYVTRPEGKFYEPFKYPRLLLTYRKGIDKLFNSDVDFDFASIEIYQNDLKLGLVGKSSYTFKAGKFFNSSKIFYPDYHHFRGNNSLIFEGSLRNFHWLDLYQNSTQKQFFEAHYEHNLGGFIVNKFPLIRKLRLEEIMGGAYLDQPSNKNYYEVFFGLQRLILRVDYALAFTNDIKVFNGFKITYGLK